MKTQVQESRDNGRTWTLFMWAKDYNDAYDIMMDESRSLMSVISGKSMRVAMKGDAWWIQDESESLIDESVSVEQASAPCYAYFSE